jgi:hypothetical protein
MKYISLPWPMVVAALSIYRRATCQYKQSNQNCNYESKERARFSFLLRAALSGTFPFRSDSIDITVTIIERHRQRTENNR